MADPKKKTQQLRTKQNVLESLKDLGIGAGSQTGDFLKSTSEDFFRELMGIPVPAIKRSGEISAGQSIQMNEVMSGKEEESKHLRDQISLERQLSSDEQRVSEGKRNELKVELQALMQEVQKVAASSENLAEATQVAMMTAPVEPGIYHINFFKNILEFLQSFRKRIDYAAAWLQSSNKRAQKKNYWNMYKKKGSSFLLSPDHYLQRSAG
ncbi:hypothetical protein A2394_01920 [Candidatus Woesebacteria bacterium RIFOXYB1_FULL_42_36]|nr:MAG: hypothetical protein A2394_01920 [Candidatus Woesebacteria bacterium RIFOXYB1_FULL_42_36]OGM84940.1 MAG: hypothetical protein A2421_00270 [Candidatus Woesebacteria bacterium RIFOXYC1_FULL_43_18]